MLLGSCTWTTLLYTSTNSTTSFDTRPHESTWIYGTNYAHARTVDTRPFFRSGRGLGTRLAEALLCHCRRLLWSHYAQCFCIPNFSFKDLPEQDSYHSFQLFSLVLRQSTVRSSLGIHATSCAHKVSCPDHTEKRVVWKHCYFKFVLPLMMIHSFLRT